MSEDAKEQTKKQIARMLASLDAAGVVLTLPDGGKALRLQHVEELLLATVEQAAIEFAGRMNTAFDGLDDELKGLLKPGK